jgi:aldehyde dehydrogenase (NAD+)
VPMRAVALAMKEPVGVIGALCADEAPLLGLVSVMAPALARGNRVVLAASTAFPLAATDFFQVLETSDVPAGVVNILTGDAGDLAQPMAAHMNVDAVWSFSSADLATPIEAASALNLKRTWVNNAAAIDWSLDHSRAFLQQATEVKNIWVPYGE